MILFSIIITDDTFCKKDEVCFTKDEILKIFNTYKTTNKIEMPIFNEFYSNYLVKFKSFENLLNTTKSIFRLDSRLGIALYGMLCFEMKSLDWTEHNELLTGELSDLFYFNRDDFINGFAFEHDQEFISSIIEHIGVPVDVSQKLGYDSRKVKNELLNYLDKHSLIKQYNIQKLIEWIKEGNYF